MTCCVLRIGLSQLAGQGLTVEIGPRDYDWGRSAYLRDPDGRLLELHEAKESTAD